MHTENFIVDDGCKCQVIEDVRAIAPNIYTAVFSEAFIVEAINLSNLSALVISSDQSNTLWVTHLKGQQKEEGLH